MEVNNFGVSQSRDIPARVSLGLLDPGIVLQPALMYYLKLRNLWD